MSNSTKFWLVLWLITAIPASYKAWHLPGKPPGERCGVVWDAKLVDALEVHKHSANVSVENYFVVKWDAGGYEEMNVSLQTYYDNPKGSRVCFDKPDYPITFPVAMLIFYSVASWLLGGLILLYGIVTFISDILDS